MRRVALAIAALLVGFLGSAATCNNENESSDVITVEGTIEFVALEGGCWTIRAQDGPVYEPTELAEELRRAGLRVRAKLRPRKDLSGICQLGTIVDVLEIEVRDAAE